MTNKKNNLKDKQWSTKLYTKKFTIDQHKHYEKSWLNSCSADGQAVPSPQVAPVVFLSLNSGDKSCKRKVNGFLNMINGTYLWSSATHILPNI